MQTNSPKNADVNGPNSGRGALLTGGLAALLASTCCLAPLGLIMLGVSGVWISKLTQLEPYQPLFIGVAVVALFCAYRRIWRPASPCAPGQVCALPSVNRGHKLLFCLVMALVMLALGFPLIAPGFY